jgi:iron complex outermembrane recepter protein
VGNNINRREQHGIRLAAMAMGIAGLSCSSAWAQQGTASTQLQGVDVTAQHIDSAPYQAPSKAPLDAIQPTSVISQQYIQNNIAPTSNYDDIVKISPSVMSISPNGPGLQENVALSIRGFQDGQFNVTFDGIPWGDTNDFTHHTTSYFETHDLGDVFVDRGPGGAATIGNATFGGTVALTTKAPSATSQLNPYIGGGSFSTLQGGLEFDTGELHQYGDATAFIDGTRSTSNGYLTYSGQTRENLFAKVVRPVGANTTVTLVGMYNHIHQNVGVGATQAQIDALGPNFMLSADPTSQNFYDYNLDEIHTDFEYIGVQSHWGEGWSLDNKVYTYAYYHTGLNGLDPNGWTPNGTEVPGSSTGPASFPNDVPGEHLTNNYRSFGDLTRIGKHFGFGDLKFGLWYDNQTNLRELEEVDMTLGDSVPNVDPDNANGGPAIGRLQHNQVVTAQPYAEFDWKVTDALTITPGLKYNFLRRRTDATVQQKTLVPADIATNYEKLLPSISAHYTITPRWSAYAQVAEGFLAPNLNLFYLPASLAGVSGLNPERTWNYQIGTAWQSERLTVSGDLYWINFNNLIQKHAEQISPTVTENVYINSGGADYKGVEAEATYYIGQGLSVFGNGSINSAKLTAAGNGGVGSDIAEVPEQTLAGGLIYNRYGIYGSFMDKWIGRRFDSANNPNDQDFSPYSDLMLSAGYTMKNVLSASSVSLKINVDNLLNVTKVDYLAGTTVGNNPVTTNPDPLYWTVAGRSVMATLSANF